MLYDAAKQELRPTAERGSVAHYLRESRSGRAPGRRARVVAGVPSNWGLAGVCAQSRRTVNAADGPRDPRYNACIDVVAGPGSSAILSVPLLARDADLVGVLQLTNPVRGSFDAADENTAALLAGHAADAIQHERLLVENLLRMKMERDLDAARTIQEGVLPRTLAVPHGYTIAALSRPAEQTGGDIYDAIWMGPTERSPVALLLADASGHGIAPALSVVQVRAMLRLGLRLGASLVDIVRQIDAQLVEDLADDQFVTAFVGCLDHETHRLEYHSAGQGPLLHFHAAEQRAEWRGATALPLGVGDLGTGVGLPHMAIEPGDFVALLTDGFYECAGPDGNLFGPERVAEVLSRRHAGGAADALHALVGELDAFAAGTVQDDDLTAIIVHRNEPEPTS